MLRRLCVDYRVINSLLPEVQKAHSKAKGVLTLVPLPQIDHIYARLRGSKIFSTFDLRSGYHHVELSLEARAKSAFVTPMDKFEFTRCLFGLSQAPAYFQRLINKVIKGLSFALGYLDDVLIHSPDLEARAKSAFVTPMDKFEFTRCLFGLSQAPAYFQRLINKVIKGLSFAFGYLDDVLIHSPDLEARAKSAFVTPMDKFEFTRCLFGLSQAPAYFQRLINKVIKGLSFAFGYLDDVLIHSPDIETHLQHMRILFQRLREADLKLKDSKCNYFKTHVQYLGHLVSGKGIRPLPEKLDSIRKIPAPTTPKEIKQFLGIVDSSRKFIPRFADIARPMTNLTRQDIPFEWTMQCQAAFEMLKEAIITSPILKYPDPNKGYTLFTDASKYAWACVLTQEYQYEKDGKEYRINHSITFASGLFKGSQMNWAALTKDVFAIYSSIKKLSYYLEDADIVLKSDHLPLKKFLQKNTLNS